MELKEKVDTMTTPETTAESFGADSDPIRHLDRLEELLTSGRALPRIGGAWVDREGSLRLIGRLRGSLPGAAVRARKVLEQREEILAAARRDAEAITAEATQRAEALVEESRLIEMAEIRSKAIAQQGEARAQELIRAAQRDASSLISQTEHSLDLLKSELREIRLHYLTQGLDAEVAGPEGETEG